MDLNCSFVKPLPYFLFFTYLLYYSIFPWFALSNLTYSSSTYFLITSNNLKPFFAILFFNHSSTLTTYSLSFFFSSFSHLFYSKTFLFTPISGLFIFLISYIIYYLHPICFSKKNIIETNHVFPFLQQRLFAYIKNCFPTPLLTPKLFCIKSWVFFRLFIFYIDAQHKNQLWIINFYWGILLKKSWE